MGYKGDSKQEQPNYILFQPISIKIRNYMYENHTSIMWGFVIWFKINSTIVNYRIKKILLTVQNCKVSLTPVTKGPKEKQYTNNYHLKCILRINISSCRIWEFLRYLLFTMYDYDAVI